MGARYGPLIHPMSVSLSTSTSGAFDTSLALNNMTKCLIVRSWCVPASKACSQSLVIDTKDGLDMQKEWAQATSTRTTYIEDWHQDRGSTCAKSCDKDCHSRRRLHSHTMKCNPTLRWCTIVLQDSRMPKEKYFNILVLKCL